MSAVPAGKGAAAAGRNALAGLVKSRTTSLMEPSGGSGSLRGSLAAGSLTRALTLPGSVGLDGAAEVGPGERKERIKDLRLLPGVR